MSPVPEGGPSEEGPSQHERISIVDVSDAIDEHAVDIGEERITAKKKELRGVKGFFKRIWRHNMAREYYRNKEIQKAREQIRTSGNLYAGEDSDRSVHDKAMEAVADRFTAEFNEAIHTDVGEQREKLDESRISDPAERNQIVNVKNEVAALIKAYATGAIPDKDTFAEEKARLFAQVKGVKPDVIQRGEMYADNLLVVAERVKRQIAAAEDKDQAFDRLNMDFDVYVGKAKEGVRTEAQFNAVDRIVDKIHNNRLGAWMNVNTLGTAVAAAYCVGSFLTKRASMSKAAAIATFGGTAILGAGLAGTVEAKRLEEERKKHFRDMAKGKEYNPDRSRSPRRVDMEKYRYETKKATDLTDELRQRLYENGQVRDLSQADLDAVLGALTEIKSRIYLGDNRKIDLIAFSDVRRVEQERWELDKAYYQARADLARKINESGGALRLPTGSDLDSCLTSLSNTLMVNMVEGDRGILEQEKRFRQMKRSRAFKAGAKALAVGLVIGTAAQETRAFFDPQTQGFVEGVVGHHDPVAPGLTTHHTMLEGLSRWLFGGKPAHADVKGVPFEFNGKHTFYLPEGTVLDKQPDGSFNLVRLQQDDVPGGVISKGIRFDQAGDLMSDSKAKLLREGVYVHEEVKKIIERGTKTETVGAPALLKQYPDLFHRIHRKMWYDNDTTGIFDKNELKLWWGGQHGSGIDDHGNFVFNVRHMTPHGSYHDGFSANAQREFAEGRMKICLSMSRDTQKFVVEVPIDTHGNAIIDPNSEAGKFFFAAQDGHAIFKGRFAEAVQVMGHDADGHDNIRMLATYEGPGMHTGHIQVPVETITSHHEKIFEIAPKSELELPPFIPFLGRTPLEPAQLRDLTSRIREYYYSGGEGDLGLLDRSKYCERFAPQLNKNKDLELSGDDLQIINEYLGRQNPEYRHELEAMVSSQPAMRPETEAVITVPAYREGKNLEKTLLNYAKLNDKQKFELVILENHPADVPRDDTEAVIQKVQAAHPDLHIIHLYKRFDEKVPIGLIRKYLVDAVLMRKSEAGLGRSIPIISNDADLEDINPDYVNDIITKFNEDVEDPQGNKVPGKNIDALAGRWDYPPEAFKQLPILHAAQRLWHYFDIAFRYYVLKSPELIGRNSAFRSGTYAAVGGYGETSTLAEDLEMGWLIKEARGYDASRIDFSNKAWLRSNPRRAVVKMLSGARLVEQYGDFHVNEDVRNASLEDLLRDRRDFNDQEFADEAQAVYDFHGRMKKSKGGWVDDSDVDKSFQRAMGFLGVKYRIEGDRVIITDMNKLRAGLEDYKNR